jgi:hypothetical protein
MNSPETNPNIEITFSLHRAGHLAHWSFKKGKHGIVVNLGNNWLETKRIVDPWRNGLTDEPATDDEYIDAFMDALTESFLTELVCIERRRQRLRMLHKRCEPCCLERIVAYMMNHCHVVLTYTKLPAKWQKGNANA